MLKAFDIFRKKSEKELKYIEEYTMDIFESFKSHVKDSRDGKLTNNPNELTGVFNADIYVANEAKALG
jgi:hypothetical protein